MTQNVIKFSQEGYEADKCADNQLLFSSLWPTLKIAHQGLVTISNPQNDQVIKTHNLDYWPFFMIDRSNDTYAESSSVDWFNVKCSKTELKWFGDASYSTDPIKIYYYIFLHDLISRYTAPILGQTSQTRKITTYGIDVVVNGKNILSPDLRNFVVHHKTKNLLLHKADYGTFTVSANEIDVTANHYLGYPPLSFLLFKSGDYYRHLVASQESFLAITDTSSNFRGVMANGDVDYAYLIFKDPV